MLLLHKLYKNQSKQRLVQLLHTHAILGCGKLGVILTTYKT